MPHLRRAVSLCNNLQVDGQKVIQARQRDDSGQVIDYSVCEGVAGFKCAPRPTSRAVVSVPSSLFPRYWPAALTSRGSAEPLRHVVVIVATSDADMLVEVVAHPVASKYPSGGGGEPPSIVASYAAAAAAAAKPETMKSLEAPCLKLCSFIATHCQVFT